MTLTPPQRRALRILAAGPARYSNHTADDPPTVYWQTADRLIEAGYARWAAHQWRTTVEITDLGRQALT